MQLTCSLFLDTLVYAVAASSVPVQYCPADQVCYQVGVPEASAERDGGNIYLQLRAPISYSWVAFGTGETMKDSSIFVMYQDGNGNVTVSARSGTGHSMPRYNSIVQLELLGGSGLINQEQTMVANVRCGNCGTWPGGSMSLDDGMSHWIAAWKIGEPINSADPDAQIRYHDGHDAWQFDLTVGTIPDDENPFLGAVTYDGISRGVDRGIDPRRIISAHGIIMALVMIVLYPAGSALMPLVGKWHIHASLQMLVFLAMIAGISLGAVSLQHIDFEFNSTHTILGTVVACLMAIQPVLGWLHHKHYVKHHSRGLISHAHIWYGRALIIAGIVNGGLGLAAAGASRRVFIVYIFFAVFIYTAYIAAALRADFVQELYLKELKAYKAPPVKDSDAVGQVLTFTAPKAPKSPEEADLASSLKEYESMAVEVEGNEGAAAGSTPAVVEDWLVDEEEEEEGAAAHH
ncbi:putative iron reductase domain protein [Daldinia sp. FL1419]|nr:putative iron reductase domain protein [Daldinia sp. FL1419]